MFIRRIYRLILRVVSGPEKKEGRVCGWTMEDDEKDFGEQDFGEQFCSLCGLYTNARFAFRQTDKQVYRTYSKRRNIT
jgi:hypothetical protein